MFDLGAEELGDLNPFPVLVDSALRPSGRPEATLTAMPSPADPPRNHGQTALASGRSRL
jgi:hypothetical protein